MVAIKALACELPHEHGLPLSRLRRLADIRQEIVRRGLVARIAESTLWRWLSEDTIRPWTHLTWIFPRDPAFAEKAGRVLDLYHGQCQGKALRAADCVLSTDEKTSIQARRPSMRRSRRRPAEPSASNLNMNTKAHGLSSPLGMSGVARPSAAANRRPGSFPSSAAWRR